MVQTATEIIKRNTAAITLFYGSDGKTCRLMVMAGNTAVQKGINAGNIVKEVSSDFRRWRRRQTKLRPRRRNKNRQVGRRTKSSRRNHNKTTQPITTSFFTMLLYGYNHINIYESTGLMYEITKEINLKAGGLILPSLFLNFYACL